MTEILNFLSSLAGVIVALVEFVFGLIGDLGELAGILVEAATAIPTVFLIMPPPATVALSAILTIAILYKTLGRE